ncbi:hypothetical protein Tco_0993941, partial [Tanacetum coccineum]
HHSEQPESIHDTYAVEKDDSKVIPDSSNVCDNDNKVDQNAEECDDERVCKSTLEDFNRTLAKSNRTRDRYLGALHDIEVELAKTSNPPIPMRIGTPLAVKPKLNADLSGTPVDQTKYHSIIGALMYLTSSRPDIMQAYLKDSSFELTAFSYVDHAGCLDKHKSTSGGIQFLGDKLVNWMSKKQDCTTMSSTEAKYVTLSASCAHVMWMKTQLKDYGFDYNKIPLTEYQLADMFSKALPEERF